jgi:hypothetical protein
MLNKKIYIITFCCFCVANYALAEMKAITNSDMDAITAQAGVDILLEGDFDLNIEMTRIAWGDENGISYIAGANNPGYLIMDGRFSVKFDTQDAAFSIDIGTANSTTHQAIPEGTPFVRLGVPNFNTIVDVEPMKIALSNTSNNLSNGNTLGTLYLDGFNINVNVNTVYVFPH